MRLLSFTMMIALTGLLGHIYVYRRVVRRISRARAWRWSAGGVLVLMTVLLASRGAFRSDPQLARVYAVVAYTWIAFLVCMVIAIAAGDVVAIVNAAISWRQRKGAPPHPAREAPPQIDEERRDFVTRALPWSVVAGGTVLTGYGAFRAFTVPEISEVVLRVPRLPKALDGLSIVQLTDIHVGPFIRRRFIDQLVAQANALHPDVLVITGDLVDGDVPTLGGSVAGLARLQARFGTYFVTGNHDYGSGDVEWAEFLEGLGISVLRNRRVAIGDGGGSIDLIGVDDWSGARRRGNAPGGSRTAAGGGYDLDAALLGRDPDRAAVLLAHQPANFEVAAQRGVDLQISGHTHGGQVFPMTMLVGLQWAYTRGLYRHGDSHIYVSRGCGFWGPPARLGSPPEIAKIILTT